MYTLVLIIVYITSKILFTKMKIDQYIIISTKLCLAILTVFCNVLAYKLNVKVLTIITFIFFIIVSMASVIVYVLEFININRLFKQDGDIYLSNNDNTVKLIENGNKKT